MDTTGPDIQKQKDDFEQAIALLPDALLPLLLSGKSVMDLAHLVKNILQILSGSVEIIELGMKRKEYDRVQRSWMIFEPNFLRLKKFLLDLIKYTRRYPLQKSMCNFNNLVQKGILAYEQTLKNKGIQVQFEQDTSIPPTLMDADRIEEAVVNLLTHAIDNLSDHNGTIILQTHLLTHPQQIELSVSDDGSALSEKAIRSLAEPFERTRTMCGTGFDIPLAMMYIEQHDGYMEIGSIPGRGNQIHVYIPVS